uniref:Uncharacterized protein n=1 Tax=Paracidobacterium acidisoli TaxID=2303751 RepID=A0A372IJP6_9BACT
MTLAWEHLIWRRRARLQIELPQHGPSFVTLIKLLAKSQVLITDVDEERLSSFLAFEPGVFAHRPAVVTLVIRTKGHSHEERLLHTLASFGYTCSRV